MIILYQLDSLRLELCAKHQTNIIAWIACVAQPFNWNVNF